MSFRRSRGTSRTYRRLLAGICLFDIISSATLTLESFIGKTDPPSHWTCAMGGIGKTAGITCGSAYNAALSSYFFVVVCFRWKEDQIVKYFEVPWHCFVASLLCYWISGLWLQVYNPSDDLGCWPAPFPKDCTQSRYLPSAATSATTETPQTTISIENEPLIIPCTRGDPLGFIFYLTMMAGFVFVCCVLMCTNLAMYFKVRKQEHRNHRYSISGPLPHNIESTGMAQKVASQSFLYCGGYLAVYIVMVAHSVATLGFQYYNAIWYPPVRILQEITFPLQGFLNFLVYFRPRYIQWTTHASEDTSRFQILRNALSIREVPTSRGSNSVPFSRTRDFRASLNPGDTSNINRIGSFLRSNSDFRINNNSRKSERSGILTTNDHALIEAVESSPSCTAVPGCFDKESSQNLSKNSLNDTVPKPLDQIPADQSQSNFADSSMSSTDDEGLSKLDNQA